MTANTEHAEQRRKQRVTIPEHPQVFDAHTGEVFGQLVNLSVDGLMIARDHCTERGSVCQLCIPLIMDGEHLEIRIGSESLWCEDVHGSGIFWTGFQIIDVSPDDQAIIDIIVAA
jgi:hypothetical protein